MRYVRDSPLPSLRSLLFPSTNFVSSSAFQINAQLRMRWTDYNMKVKVWRKMRYVSDCLWMSCMRTSLLNTGSYSRQEWFVLNIIALGWRRTSAFIEVDQGSNHQIDQGSNHQIDQGSNHQIDQGTSREQEPAPRACRKEHYNGGRACRWYRSRLTYLLFHLPFIGEGGGSTFCCFALVCIRISCIGVFSGWSLVTSAQ
jgi:hypothetical protein